MEYAIMGLAFGVCLFILPLWAYRKGLTDGLKLNQGKPIEPLTNPIKAVIEHVEAKSISKATQEANNTMIQGFQNMMSYTGDDQTKVGEK